MGRDPISTLRLEERNPDERRKKKAKSLGCKKSKRVWLLGNILDGQIAPMSPAEPGTDLIALEVISRVVIDEFIFCWDREIAKGLFKLPL